jgi:hypothetical protein
MPRPGARPRQRGKGKSSAGGRRAVQGTAAAASAWRAAPLLAQALLSVALAGCGAGDGDRSLPPEWRGRDLEEPGWANGTLKPGWGLGLEYVWSAGTPVKWDWFADVGDGRGILHFQVVRIEGGEAQPLVSSFANESADGLTVPRAGAHQILWRNESPLDVRFWYKVPEGHGAPRAYSPAEGPDCILLLAAAGASGPGLAC